MWRDVQLPDAAAELLDVAVRTTPTWMRRVVVGAAGSAWQTNQQLRVAADEMIEREAPQLLDALAALLATDVDEQRTNPLSLYRSAVGAPTQLLRTHGVAPPPDDAFVAAHFPGDVYRLGPASWSDIDPRLHEPGLVWGAWKAMTILRRRRDEGVR